MLRCTLPVLVALALVAPLGAQDLPLPTKLKEAEIARVLNDGAPDGLFKRLITELREWKRFELVADKDKADITITMGMSSTNVFNAGIGRNNAVNRMTVTYTDNTDDEVLHSDVLGGGMTGRSIIRGYLKRLDARLKADVQ